MNDARNQYLHKGANRFLQVKQVQSHVISCDLSPDLWKCGTTEKARDCCRGSFSSSSLGEGKKLPLLAGYNES